MSCGETDWVLNLVSGDLRREPLREWLRGVEPADCGIAGEDVKDVGFVWPIGMPLVRPLGRGLWEVRGRIGDGKIARVFFCVDRGGMVLSRGFMKKSEKTPKKDMDLALGRKKETVR